MIARAGVIVSPVPRNIAASVLLIQNTNAPQKAMWAWRTAPASSTQCAEDRDGEQAGDGCERSGHRRAGQGGVPNGRFSIFRILPACTAAVAAVLRAEMAQVCGMNLPRRNAAYAAFIVSVRVR